MKSINKVSKIAIVASLFIASASCVYAMDRDDGWQLKSTGIPISFKKEENGKITVTTDDNNWASYQLESKRFSVKPGERIRIFYDISVKEGGIMSLGLLSTSKTWWYPSQVNEETAELILKTGRHQDIFERIVPMGETETSIVFRNYHLGTPGQTTFTIESIDIQKEDSVQLNSIGIPTPADRQLPENLDDLPAEFIQAQRQAAAEAEIEAKRKVEKTLVRKVAQGEANKTEKSIKKPLLLIKRMPLRMNNLKHC